MPDDFIPFHYNTTCTFLIQTDIAIVRTGIRKTNRNIPKHNVAMPRAKSQRAVRLSTIYRSHAPFLELSSSYFASRLGLMILSFIWSSAFGILLFLNLRNVDLLIITITINLLLISSYQNINKFITCKSWSTIYSSITNPRPIPITIRIVPSPRNAIPPITASIDINVTPNGLYLSFANCF